MAAMATVSSMLHEAFAYYSWTGFYRVAPEVRGARASMHACMHWQACEGHGQAVRDKAW